MPATYTFATATTAGTNAAPRYPCFDSYRADQHLTTNANAPNASDPFRIYSAHGETPRTSLEFVYSGNLSTALDVRFYFEYFGDVPALDTDPTTRRSTLLNPSTPWARECTQLLGANGLIQHRRTAHRVLQIAADATGVGTARYVHGVGHFELWARLAIWIDTAIPSNARLQVFAYTAGSDYVDESYA